MKSDNFIVIQGWMCNELELKGNDLLVFALIYGFSQDEESRFSGSRKYIAETFNISLPTVDKTLKNLIEKGLIEQHKTEINGIVFNEYNSLQGVKKLYGGSKETLPNKANKQTNRQERDNSKELSSKEKIDSFLGSGKKKEPRQSLYSKCIAQIDSRDYDNDLHNALVDYLQVRLQMKDRQLYANSWKGLLNKLERDFTNDEERLQSVYQSIERGYASFFPVNKSKKNYTQADKPWNEGVSGCNKQTKEEKEEMERWQEEMRKKGVRVDF